MWLEQLSGEEEAVDLAAVDSASESESESGTLAEKVGMLTSLYPARTTVAESSAQWENLT